MFKKLGSNIIIYGGTNAIKSLVPFLMLPILTKYLTTEDYGVLSLIEVSILFLVPFITLNSNSAINVEYFNLEKNKLKLYISNALILSLIASFIIFSLFYIFQKNLSQSFAVDSVLILWLPIFALLRVVSSIVLGLYQVSDKAIKFASYTVFQTVIDFALSFVFVVYYKLGYVGRLEGVYIAFFIGSAYGLYILHKTGHLDKINFKFSKDILSYGLPLIPHVLSGIILAMSDRYFISYFVGNDAVGYYSVAYQMASIMLLLSVSINQAWMPMLYKLLSSYQQNKNTIISYTKYLGILYIGFGFMIYMVSDIIFSIFVDQKFYIAKEYFPILLVGFVFQSLYYLFTNILFFYKKTKLLAKLTFFSVILNIVLNYILIVECGVIGVAYATTITYIFYLFIIVYHSQKIIKKENTL